MIPNSDVILETLQDGEIVLTTLKRDAMPLIRYRTGDLGELTSNEILSSVLGRKQEGNKPVSIMALDDVRLSCDAILDYSASFGGTQLFIYLAGDAECVHYLLCELPPLIEAWAS